MSKPFFDEKNDVDSSSAVSALALCPTIREAKIQLEQLGYAEKAVSERRLEVMKGNKGEEIEKLRREYAPQLEATLTGDMLDEARYATEVISLAIRRTEERLKANIVSDPAKVARDLSQIRSQGIEKKLALEGRPTSISESRNTDEVIRALEGLGVAKQVTVESTAVEE